VTGDERGRPQRLGAVSGDEDDVDFLTLLPMAVVMVAGPQFVSAVFLATSRHPKLASSALVATASDRSREAAPDDRSG
jgi:hypothetical protein